MAKTNKKFYVTTSIPYVNADPHIGFALEAIQADVLARYHRLKGEDVFFLTGTDEHGVKVVRAAEAVGETPKEFVDEISGKFKALKKTLILSWDDFIRTSDQKRHWPGAQKLWLKLYNAGKLYKKPYKGLYCIGHEAFITEKDLIDGKCRDHQKDPEVVEEENWFFKLSEYSNDIKSKIESGELTIVPEGRKNEIISLINEGLEDVSFSRPAKDLSWGIPVPNDPKHTMYVWCDALSNYISALGYGSTQNIDISKFQKYWPADIHIIGKDILRFHAAIWPGMLLAAELPLPKTIFVHGFITVGGEKMSKTIGNVINPVEIVNKYGADALRYYLLWDITPTGDGDFTYEKFEERYNSGLANGIGNLVARVAKLGETISPIVYSEDDIAEWNRNTKKNIHNLYDKLVDDIKLNEALAVAFSLVYSADKYNDIVGNIKGGDKYIDETQPWTLRGDDLKKVIINASFLINSFSELIEPFLPETAGKIREQIKFVGNKIEITKGDNIFPRK
ncbi:MAG: methionine--tRNA ligase [Parcubacteria group bacterium]|nr:methionine--tRNA ligase [Parcubacteria group bacterium]